MAVVAGILQVVTVPVAVWQFMARDDVNVDVLSRPVTPTAPPTLLDEPDVDPEVPWETVVGQVCAPSFVLPESLSEIPRPPETQGAGAAEFEKWGLDRGGVYADYMAVSFRVAGESPDATTTISDVAVYVTDRDEPMAGTWLEPNGCDAGPLRELYVDLDPEQVKPAVVRGGEEDWQFGRLTTSATDPELFTIVVQTSKWDVHWVAVVEVQDVDGDEQQILVTDHGEPFHVTAHAGATEHAVPPRGSYDAWPR